MKGSDKSMQDRPKIQGKAQNSNVVGFSAFKEKRAEDEYKKAIGKIIARAQKTDW